MVGQRDFSRRDQRQALAMSTLAFTLCLAVWTLFSISGIQIKQELNLSDSQLGLLMATPILSGSISRLFLGLLSDRFGGRWVFGLLMITAASAVYLLSLAVMGVVGVWSIWSILVFKLPQVGFSYSSSQLFWLAALPSLSGATLRLFYSFVVPLVGGRRWTAISTASLLLPCLWLGVALQNPDTPYLVMLILALLCGFGGGNVASSMANISFFDPQKEKVGAMVMHAGLGNTVGVTHQSLAEKG